MDNLFNLMETEVAPSGAPKSYSYDDVYKASLDYFKGDELAARVWSSKYALKDSFGNIYELTPDDMHRRIAREIARVEAKYPNPMSEEEVFNLLKDFKYIVPQGSPMAGIGNNFQVGSLSNCFVIGLDGKPDSYGGIIRIDEEQVQLMKRRGGVGHDLSHIRPKGMPVKNSALTSTGLVPFMERYSNSTREVAQDGRRGALMMTVSIKHPDSEAFIDAKMEEGKVTGANVSVRIDDEFMNSAVNNVPYKQTFPVDKKLIYSGLFLIISGIIKNGLIADYIAQYNDWIFEDPNGFSGFEVFMGVFGYTMQIYCDFSGYSDFSIGLAALMGIRLLPNFNSPYQSLNLQEFWHRWHIALSTWFRDYIYIPLGGNRKGKFRTYLNNFITMLFAGWWHGASWMFILWGAIHGVGLMVHKSCKPWLKRLGEGFGVKFGAWLITFIYVAFAWIFFRASSMEIVGDVLSKIFTDFDLAYLPPFCTARPLWIILTMGAFFFHLAIKENMFYRLQDMFVKMPWIVKFLIFIVAVQLVINFKLENVNPFIYAQF